MRKVLPPCPPPTLPDTAYSGDGGVQSPTSLAFNCPHWGEPGFKTLLWRCQPLSDTMSGCEHLLWVELSPPKYGQVLTASTHECGLYLDIGVSNIIHLRYSQISMGPSPMTIVLIRSPCDNKDTQGKSHATMEAEARVTRLQAEEQVPAGNISRRKDRTRGTDSPLLAPSQDAQPCQARSLDFWPPELRENTSLLS